MKQFFNFQCVIFFSFAFFATPIFAAAGTVTVSENIHMPSGIGYRGDLYQFAAGHSCAGGAPNYTDATSNGTPQPETRPYKKQGDACMFYLVDIPQSPDYSGDPLPAVFNMDGSCNQLQLQCYGGIGQCTNPHPITPKIASPTVTFTVNYVKMQTDPQTGEDVAVFNVSCASQGL